MSMSPNTKPFTEIKTVWASAPGSVDLSLADAMGQLPRGLAVQGAGTLVVQTNSGETVTLTSGSPALQLLLACSCISKLIASGSTAYNIVVGY